MTVHRGLRISMMLAISSGGTWCAAESCPQIGRDATIHSLTQSFYIWQYEWSAPVTEAVARTAALQPDALYVVAGEIGGAAEPQPDWNVLAEARTPVVPVVRVYANASHLLEKDPSRLLNELTALFCGITQRTLNAGVQVRELQLDLDCPQRLLTNYATLLKAIKPRLAGFSLSITALPCQVTDLSFRTVIETADSYILQVHSVAFPENIRNRTSIVDLSVADEAIAAADRLARPYHLALPTYACRLVFDNATGKCLGLLQPFSPYPDPGDRTIRVVAPDIETVRLIHRQAGQSEYCRGIVWFRMPVEGDDSCWDLSTLAAIHEDKSVITELNAYWHRAADGNLELIIENHANLTSQTAIVTLAWQGSQGDYGLIGAGNAADLPVPGILPTQIIMPVPSPGTRLTAAWFRTSQPPPSIRLTHR